MQASEGESESSQGSSDEEERTSIAPNATTSSGPSSFASRNASSTGAEIKRIRRRRRKRRRRRRRGRGMMKRGRRMSGLPLHQRTLGRRIQGKNPRGEGNFPSR